MVLHMAWMYEDLGYSILAADLDAQSNLTAAFLDDDRLEEVLAGEEHALTIHGALEPLRRGLGDVGTPYVEAITDRLGLVPGDMALSTFEDQLSEVWPKCLDRDERAFRVTSAFWRGLQGAAKERGAELILIDLGPNLGAINRAALIASSHVVIPLGPDLFSLQGLKNLGPTLFRWRQD
jgi:chromosome partitioning protein